MAFIAITEDGDMSLIDSITDEDLQAVDMGILDLIDVSTADKPLRFWDEKWELLKKVGE
jgi:hypothetical protein